MKTLRAKQNSMRTVMTSAFSAVLFAVMAVSREAAVMTATGGWSKFKSSMTSFFYNGLGLEGLQGLGIAIAVIGIALAVVSFVVHKMNPQSRMPGWFTCLIVAFIGTMLCSGIKPVIGIVYYLRDTVLGWFGFDGFGKFE